MSLSQGRRSGVRIPLTKAINKDELGFDDIDNFWDASESISTKSRRMSDNSEASKRIRRSSGVRSSITSTGESEVFDYDTSNSISDEEDDNVDTDTEEMGMDTSIGRSPVTKSRSPKSSSGNKRKSNSYGSTDGNTGNMMDMDDGGGFDFDDGGMDVDMGDMDMPIDDNNDSPFNVGGSPSNRPSSIGRSGSSSGGKARRVSFGAGTKDDDIELPESPVATTGRSSYGSSNKKLKSKSTSSSSSKKSRDHRSSLSDGATSPDTPGGASVISTPGSNEFVRGRKIMDETFYEDDDDDTDSDIGGDAGGVNESFLDEVRDKSYVEDDDDGARRSRRATKGKRFQYWKNERPVYDKGQIIGLLTADPTPKKKSNGGIKKSSSSSSGGVKRDASDKIKRDKAAPVKLPNDVKFLNDSEAETLSVWDDPNDNITSARVVCQRSRLGEPSELPITAKRQKGKNGVGSAMQFFSQPEIPNVMSGWISGYVVLPPGAIKDAEGVGECSQVFFIADCQDGSVELGIADPKEEVWRDDIAQRVIMNTGDSFFVPPGNIYRLENHSSTSEAIIYWTIVKPLS